MDYNDEMKRLGEHPAMKEIPENFEDSSIMAAAGAAAAVPHKSYWGRAVIVAIGATALAAAVFLLSDTYYSQKASYDQAHIAAAGSTTGTGGSELVEIDAIAFSSGNLAQAVPAATDANATTAKTTATTPSGDATPDAVYLFPNDGSTISSNADLDAVAKEAVAENADVVVTAYTGETGSASYNQRLSERRAKAVGDYLVAHGVAPEHIRTEGCGQTHAFATNALDRRAEVRIVS